MNVVFHKNWALEKRDPKMCHCPLNYFNFSVPVFGDFVLAAPRFSFMSLKISCSLLLDLIGQRMNLEPVQARYKLVGWSFWPVLRVHHEKHVREACPKVGPISVVVS